MAQTKFSKVGNQVIVANPLIADITRLELFSAGTPKNVLKTGTAFEVQIDIEYPEIIADAKAEFTLDLQCIQLVPGVGVGPYTYTTTANLLPDKTKSTFQIPFTAVSPGTKPGVYWFLATLNFGPSSDFAAYLFGFVLFVFP